MNPAMRIISGLALAVSVASAEAVDAPDRYLEHCASCHGPDGKGRTPAGKKLRAKDLTESRIPDDEILRQILDGTKDAKGNARMPAFREKITVEEASDLATFVKTFRKEPSRP